MMSAVQGSTLRLACLLLLGATIAACTEAGFKDKVYESAATVEADAAATSDAGVTADAGSPANQPYTCTLAESSDVLPPRASVLSESAGPGATGVFTSDLFNLFRSHCGGCHVDQGLGDLKVSLQSFPVSVTSQVLERIRSDDEAKFMPPLASAGKPFSQRPPGDPVVELASLIEAWLAAGSPVDVFYPEVEGSAGGQKPFALSQAVGMAMTNLGNCIPSAPMVGSEKDESAALDTMFEQATGLPERLEQTDLVSLDSEVLARRGVVAFAPTYTLWADNAKKLRMVRVPRGQTIKFDKQTQTFDVPPNTRFYKTFFKRVIDHRGNESYRKLETRLIVSRPDQHQPDGSYVTSSLFGTYAWNEAETEAVLLRDPLRNGKPFRDRIVTYIADEQAAEEVIAKGPENLQQELQDRGLSRTWALPSSDRCIHCHMGAPNKSFVLGFTPLQLLRRPLSEGGVIEPAARDELSQLQRMIDYGIISGMTSPRDVLPLEQSQGERKPRNEHELAAQGYMLGNCAHCHNPRGFPSQVAPELRDSLNFDPTAEGGIFEFPLDRMSPRIQRGPTLADPIPYLSPSLYDVPEEDGVLNPNAKVIGTRGCTPRPDGTAADCYKHLLAPWRSLIYRNVDAPFSYAEDSAIFPHMPMDTPGYDCRARQLMGTWMVSIPVAWKYTAYVPTGTNNPPKRLYEWEFAPPASDDPQPYTEIRPGEPNYKAAQFSAQTRVRTFRESPRYNDCPPSSLDIVDPRVVRGEAIVPGPTLAWPMLDAEGKPALDSEGLPTGYYSLNVPERPHVADTDLTQAPGDWYPRRPDWDDVLVADHDQLPPATPLEAKVVELLQKIRVTEDFRTLALTDVPFGLWQKKDGCDFASQAKVSDFQGEARPRWIETSPFLGQGEPVYSISPGGMVFTSICANCHGPTGDSQGRLAATIADMTGGQTLVANLRDGLFGPPALQGSNIDRVFGDAVGPGLTAEDWAARYVLWMGLGGTQRVIPPAALTVVGSTRILGKSRVGALAVKDANMLSVARNLCRAVLDRSYLDFDAARGIPDYGRSALIAVNGDAEMWERLCSYENELPVVKVEFAAGGLRTQGGVLYPRDRYPLTAPVGDPSRGVTNGIQAGNPAPFCLVRPAAQVEQAKLETAWKAAVGDGVSAPYCPEALTQQQNELTEEAKDAWTLRGALSAGLSVFVYLEALTQGEKQAPIPYDRCEELTSR